MNRKNRIEFSSFHGGLFRVSLIIYSFLCSGSCNSTSFYGHYLRRSPFCLDEEESLLYRRESSVLLAESYPQCPREFRFRNGNSGTHDCHAQVYCPFGSCRGVRVTRTGFKYGNLCRDKDEDTFLFYNVDKLFLRLRGDKTRCAVQYNCLKKGYVRPLSELELLPTRNPYYGDLKNESKIDEPDIVKKNFTLPTLRSYNLTEEESPKQTKDGKLPTNVFELSCKTADSSRNCVTGYYKMESNHMVYFHTVNCFPGFNLDGRNLNPYLDENTDYYCPTSLPKDRTVYRSMPNFWTHFAKCVDTNPDCYSTKPLEVIEGFNMSKACSTVDGRTCFSRPWMDEDGYWRSGCTFIMHFKKWMCAVRVGTTGIVLEYGECIEDTEQEHCMNGRYHLTPMMFMHPEMKKPWIRVFAKKFEPGMNTKDSM